MVKTLKQSLLIFILSNLLILWLYLFNNFFVVDVLIVTSNIFSFVLNNIYICLLFKTINYYNSIKNFIMNYAKMAVIIIQDWKIWQIYAM